MRGRVEDLLRCEGAYGVEAGGLPLRSLLAIFFVAGFVYGLAMGSFGLRPLQMLFSALKVPLLLVVSSLVVLPSFFVLNTVLGLRDDLASALKGIIAAQVTMSVSLCALARITLVAYASSGDYRFALNFNGLPFLVALCCGYVTLGRHYRPLVARNRQHRVARAAWLGLYAFVAIQAAWVMRPFVGDPSLPPALLREEAWSNAYVEIIADLVKLSGGR